ncbi:hypothetical protein AN395_03094 [Pseudoalteromonas sp. P1-30]|uniref:hypothetical protein n=1 Tax=unclassified Pseudoalteromonas TaxID=194690 RepID=UPI0006D64CD7|nr:hypothetical protein [Pseudoalteromonas sp. P1-30]KPV90500.1 hypothetical protein AN395_03094 [Pseudoalteromonas sp. P1-30]
MTDSRSLLSVILSLPIKSLGFLPTSIYQILALSFTELIEQSEITILNNMLGLLLNKLNWEVKF